jgi:hypothetical protein
MATIDDIKEYYADLLILQYRNKQKARDTIQTGIDIYLADGLILQLDDLLNIDTAIGVQLDTIGKILDCPREVPGINVQTKFFSFHIDETSLGFSTVGNPSNGVVKSRFNSDLAIYSLLDSEYRQLLKFKAFVNVWRGDMGSMNKALYSVFGDNINLKNNQDLSVTYEIGETNNVIDAAITLGYLRAPIGITVNYDYGNST